MTMTPSTTMASVPSGEALALTTNGRTTQNRQTAKSSVTLVGSKVWEIAAPPPSNTFKGTLVPSSLAFSHKHRLVSLELHRFPIRNNDDILEMKTSALGTVSSTIQKTLAGNSHGHSHNEGEGIDYYEECILRILIRDWSWKRIGRNKETSAGSVTGITARSMSVMTSTLAEEEDTSAATTMMGAFIETDGTGSPKYPGWKCKYRVPIRKFSTKHVEGEVVPCVMQVNVHKQTRLFVFKSEEEAWEFSKFVDYQKRMEERRAPIRLKAQLGSVKSGLDEELTLLVEIVSAWNLPGTSLHITDPYVECYFNGKDVHRTQYIPNTLDPIWTVKTGSLFLLKCTVRQLFSCEGLMCDVFRLSQFKSDDKVGTVTVPSRILFQGTGERREFKLTRAQGQAQEVKGGMLAVRCRHASAYDLKMMESIEKDELVETSAVVRKVTHSKGGKNDIQSITTSYKRKTGYGANRAVRYRVRPEPDPKRPQETAWLTKAEIQKEILRDSFHWLDSGVGSVGRLYVEILGCDELPNLDAGQALGNKTDSFVAVIYENAMLKTDIIDDCLNPRWLPWSKRAFIFHMLHPSSQLFLGVFDYEPLTDHELIGRVAIDLCNLRPNTTYTLMYDIFPTAELLERTRKGSITVRLRLDVSDPRKRIVSSLTPPPKFFINVKNMRDFHVLQHTCRGKYDMEGYNMKVINSYIDELTAYKMLLYDAQDVLLALVLWRGHYPVTIWKRTLRLPAHSAVAFCMCTFLVEHPSKFPSIFCATIAWFLLGLMGWRCNQVPNPWYGCTSFVELTQTLAIGHSTLVPEKIESFQNINEVNAFEARREKRFKELKEAARHAREEAQRQREEELRKLEEVGGTGDDMITKVGVGWFNANKYRPTLLKTYLFPLQQQLGRACTYLRIARHIVMWTDSFLAYWTTLAFLALAVLFYFVPWFFLAKWVSRVAVWVGLGPWMKLVDIYYVQKIESRTQEEKERLRMTAEEARLEKLNAAVLKARIKRENTEKLKAMKKIMFGSYVARVPVLKKDIQRDIPRPASSAVPYRQRSNRCLTDWASSAASRQTRLPGQLLVGDMIPRPFNNTFKEDPSEILSEPLFVIPDEYAETAEYAKMGLMCVGIVYVGWVSFLLLWPALRGLWTFLFDQVDL